MTETECIESGDKVAHAFFTHYSKLIAQAHKAYHDGRPLEEWEKKELYSWTLVMDVVAERLVAELP